MPGRFQAPYDLGRLGKVLAGANVDTDGQPLALLFVDQLEQLRPQRRRKIIDRVEADVFERVYGRRLARAAHSGDDDEGRAHRAASWGPMMTWWQATTCSPRTTMATSATVATSSPGQTTWGQTASARRTNSTPPILCCTNSVRPEGSVDAVTADSTATSVTAG